MKTQKTYHVEDDKYIKMPSRCWGNYACVTVESGSHRAYSSGSVCMGKTDKCAHAKALIEAKEICKNLNRKEHKNYMARVRRASKKFQAEMARLKNLTRCCRA